MDPIVAEEEIPKPAETHAEGKTEQTVHQLESEINKAYDSVEKRFGELWTSASKNAEGLQEQYHLDQRKDEILKQLNNAKANINDKAKVSEHLAQFETQFKSLKDQVQLSEVNLPDIDFKKLNQQANTYLDTLDNRLEQVEKQAGKYVNQFASFLTGIVSVDNGDSTTEQTFGEDKETLFSSTLGSNYGTSRYDSELFKLHTTAKLFLNEDLDVESELKAFKVDAKTEEISKLLEKYDQTLRKLMNELVPVKISYQSFWYRYFKLENNLKEQEEKRRQLLQSKESKSGANEEEEEFTWDDDDEEDEVVDVGKEVKLESKDDDDDWE